MSTAPSPSLPRYGIVLLPDPKTEAAAIELSARFRPFSALEPDGQPQVALSAAGQRPHVSLFHVALRRDNVHALVSAVAKCCSGNLFPGGRLHTLEVFHGEWLFWMSDIQSGLFALHLEILDTVPWMREENITDPDEPGLTPDERQAASRYGFLNADRAWKPHVTLAKVRPDFVLDPTLVPAPMAWGSDGVSVVELGPHGTVGRVIETIPFRTPDALPPPRHAGSHVSRR